MFLFWNSYQFHCINCRGQLWGSDFYHFNTSSDISLHSSRSTIYPSLSPCERTTVLKAVYIQDKFCIIHHIHLYFPFTTGHLNHIRIYYHHADSTPADNTNHDKMEQWLHKHSRLYITSYELGWISDPTCLLYVIVYLYRWTKDMDIITSLSVFNLCLLLPHSNNGYTQLCVYMCVCLSAVASITQQ